MMWATCVRYGKAKSSSQLRYSVVVKPMLHDIVVLLHLVLPQEKLMWRLYGRIGYVYDYRLPYKRLMRLATKADVERSSSV